MRVLRLKYEDLQKVVSKYLTDEGYECTPQNVKFVLKNVPMLVEAQIDDQDVVPVGPEIVVTHPQVPDHNEICTQCTKCSLKVEGNMSYVCPQDSCPMQARIIS